MPYYSEAKQETQNLPENERHILTPSGTHAIAVAREIKKGNKVLILPSNKQENDGILVTNFRTNYWKYRKLNEALGTSNDNDLSILDKGLQDYRQIHDRISLLLDLLERKNKVIPIYSKPVVELAKSLETQSKQGNIDLESAKTELLLIQYYIRNCLKSFEILS